MMNSEVNPNPPYNILKDLDKWNTKDSKTYISSKDKTNSKSINAINDQTALIGKPGTKFTTSDITELIKKQLDSSKPSAKLVNAGIATLEKFKARIKEKRQNFLAEKIMGSLKSKIENCRKNRGWIDSLDYIEKTEKQLISQLPINKINNFLKTSYHLQTTISTFNSDDLKERMKTDRLLKTTSQLLNAEDEQLEVSDPMHLPRTPSLRDAPRQLKISGEFMQDVHRLKSVKFNKKDLVSIDETTEDNYIERSKSELETAQKQLEQTTFNLSTRLTGELGPVAFKRLTSLMTQSSFKDFIDDLRVDVFPFVSTSERDPICTNTALKENPNEAGVDFSISTDTPDVIKLTAKMTLSITQFERDGILTFGYLSLYREYSAPTSEWTAPCLVNQSVLEVMPHLKVVEVFSKVQPTIAEARQEVEDLVDPSLKIIIK
jgi:hypothetical protein